MQKPVHGYLHRELRNQTTTNYKASNLSTKSLSMSAHLEGYLCAIQEQEVETRFILKQRATPQSQVNPMCRHCGLAMENITHIIGSCPRLSASLYLPLRHNEVAKSLYNAILRTVEPKHDFVKPKEVFKVGPLEIWWDKKIKVTGGVEFDKPDIVLWNSHTWQCKIVEVGVPLDVNVAKIENEKRDKYVTLAVALKRLYPQYNFTTISVVVGATGFITNAIFNAMKELDLEDRAMEVIRQLQSRAIAGTIKVVKSAMTIKK